MAFRYRGNELKTPRRNSRVTLAETVRISRVPAKSLADCSSATSNKMLFHCRAT